MMGFLSFVVQSAILLLPKELCSSWIPQSFTLASNHNHSEAIISISNTWHVLGPFQIGTREAAWSSDPLEYYGGFSSLKPNASATFASSIARKGKVGWSTVEIDSSPTAPSDKTLSFAFTEEVDWPFLQQVYGWAALQWQAWARGEIVINSSEERTVLLYTDSILEYVIDGKRSFGGDFFAFRRSPAVLRLSPGVHVIDIRLVRDVRAMGGIGPPTLNIVLAAKAVDEPGLHVDHILVSDVVNAKLSSPYASVVITNTRKSWVTIGVSSSKPNVISVKPLIGLSKEFTLAPGQSRPYAMLLKLLDPYATELSIRLLFQEIDVDAETGHGAVEVAIKLKQYSKYDTHKVTHLHRGNVVSYASVRAPSPNATCASNTDRAPVMVVLHGAGVEADNPIAKDALKALPNLCSWVLTPSGTTPWSGDDWHTWGWADVQSSVDALPLWLIRNEWDGIGLDTEKILLIGHSNGGQGVWYGLTHHPDKLIAAAPLSGYVSIFWYVPTVFWQSNDPSRQAVIRFAQASFSHDLMTSNFAHVPIYQQHGDFDDNVPVFHSSLMHQRIAQSGFSSSYDVVKSQGHWWETVATEPKLAKFYSEVLKKPRMVQLHDVNSFEIVVADPGDATGRFGVRILYLQEQGSMGSLKVIYIKERRTWRFVPKNVMAFEIPYSDSMAQIEVDDENGIQVVLDRDLRSESGRTIVWRLPDDSDWTLTDPPYPPTRKYNHFGGLSSILRAENGPFIVRVVNSELMHLALQVSRNLNTYYGADAEIMQFSQNVSAIAHDTYAIVLCMGNTMPSDPSDSGLPIRTVDVGSQARIRYRMSDDRWRTFAAHEPHGAIFLRPRHEQGLEIVVWGSDIAMMEQMARLLPMMTGTGQPDWVMCKKEMMWKGIEGCDLGWFDAWWRIQR